MKIEDLKNIEVFEISEEIKYPYEDFTLTPSGRKGSKYEFDKRDHKEKITKQMLSNILKDVEQHLMDYIEYDIFQDKIGIKFGLIPLDMDDL